MNTRAAAASSGNRRAGPRTSFVQNARQWWAGLQPREQQLLGIGAAVVLIAVLWLVAIQPAWLQIRQAPAQLAAMDAQSLKMQRLGVETRELRGAPQVSAAQSATALRAASARLGAAAKLAIQGDRGVLTVDGLSSEELRAWLAEARSGARARAVEAQLTRGAKGFSGTITVALAAGDAP